MTFLLPAEVRDAVLRYLVTRPYSEVAEGVRALLDLKPAPPPKQEQD
jgi:hypothetical protein